MTEDYQTLGRSYSLPRIMVYGETNSARFKLIKSGTQKQVGLPKYYKNRKTKTTIPSYMVMDGCQYSVMAHHVYIPMSRRMRKRYDIGRHFKIAYNGLPCWKGKQQRGQIHLRDGKFYLHQSVEVCQPKQKTGEVVAGLDLGIKRVFGLYISNGEEKAIGSRRFLRHWQHYTELIATEKSRLARQGRRTSRKVQRLYRKRTIYLSNLHNNLVAKLFRILNRNKVSILFVGDIKHICKDNDKGRTLNRMTHNYWSFGSLLGKIENKAEEFGIRLVKVPEPYTSQECPICGHRQKSNCKDRIFVCSFCGYVDHRDIVGARNILKRGMRGLEGESTHRGETAPLVEAVA